MLKRRVSAPMIVLSWLEFGSESLERSESMFECQEKLASLLDPSDLKIGVVEEPCCCKLNHEAQHDNIVRFAVRRNP